MRLVRQVPETGSARCRQRRSPPTAREAWRTPRRAAEGRNFTYSLNSSRAVGPCSHQRSVRKFCEHHGIGHEHDLRHRALELNETARHVIARGHEDQPREVLSSAQALRLLRVAGGRQRLVADVDAAIEQLQARGCSCGRDPRASPCGWRRLSAGACRGPRPGAERPRSSRCSPPVSTTMPSARDTRPRHSG